MAEDRSVMIASHLLVGDIAMTIICHDCAAERVISVDEINNEDLYSCPAGCAGWAGMKYWPADPCKNCGKLGFWSKDTSYCCSRPCMLQAEYATTLKAGA